MTNELKDNLIKDLLKESLRVDENIILQLNEHEILTLVAIMRVYGVEEARKVITGEHVYKYELLENIELTDNYSDHGCYTDYGYLKRV